MWKVEHTFSFCANQSWICYNCGCVWMHVQMSVQEFSANSTILDLLERAGRASSRLTTYRFPLKEELRPRLNHKPVSDPNSKLKMGDVIELTPAIPDKYLTEYREEIQRMYDRGLTVSSMGNSASTMVGSRSWPHLGFPILYSSKKFSYSYVYTNICTEQLCFTTMNLLTPFNYVLKWFILSSCSLCIYYTSHPLRF